MNPTTVPLETIENPGKNTSRNGSTWSVNSGAESSLTSAISSVLITGLRCVMDCEIIFLLKEKKNLYSGFTYLFPHTVLFPHFGSIMATF